MKKILVTGANGFLGSHLIKTLINEGHRPIAYLRQGSDQWRLKHVGGAFDIFISDNNTEDDLKRLFELHDIEIVLHTATQYGAKSSLSDILTANVLFPIKLIEAGLKYYLKLFVNTDTFFGKEQYDLKYLNNYTVSKRILSGLLKNLGNNLNITNLRIEHLFGESDAETKFVTSILKQAIQNKPEILLTTGLQRRDFIYVDDAANAFIAVIGQENFGTGYHEYEVGTGGSISVKEFVTQLAEITNSRSFFNFGAVPTYEGEIQDSFANTEPLKKLGWYAKHDTKSALKKIVQTEIKRFTNEN